MRLNVKMIAIMALSMLAAACMPGGGVPYGDGINTLSVQLVYPQDYEEMARQGVRVTVEDISLGNRYQLLTDAAGRVDVTLPDGLYRISVSDICDSDIFNGTADRYPVTGGGTSEFRLELKHARAGSIIIKEIYCGGCVTDPPVKYQTDKYVMIHNNNYKTEYLDSLCFGSLYPYNSNSNNAFAGTAYADADSGIPSFAPVIQAVWQVGGTGTSFPLEPGEDAVICICGAIDHTIQYPNSVNLNRPDCFVCYNNTYFPNPTYHPAPGNLIDPSRILDVVVKTGKANGYTFSLNSPAVVLFRAGEGSMKEFVREPANIVQVPGSTSDMVVSIPFEWVCDAVEVFNGASSSNSKRMPPALDAGYITLAGSYLSHSLMRKVDEERTREAGYEVLCDTNNSSEDFCEMDKPSLHE